ncbi:FAD-dependent oxidoreductase [Streptomyces sp. E-08]|uniref:FAD-dependent oxidoreductase n=1 Tax=Streptomyces sp. E-08 TaxID=3404047 RepID=UPI003CED2F8E
MQVVPQAPPLLLPGRHDLLAAGLELLVEPKGGDGGCAVVGEEAHRLPVLVVEGELAVARRDQELPDDVSLVHERDGRSRAAEARHCVSSIPVPVLRGIGRPGFSPAFESAVRVVEFEKTCKAGWQAERRFWEDDPSCVYGGSSWTSHPITQIW